MTVRIFPLRYVPPEEAEAVRDALTEAGIEFYETPPSTPGTADSVFGSQTEAIWVSRNADAPAAFAIIERYQAQLRGKNGPAQHDVVAVALGRMSRTPRLIVLLICIVLVLLLGAALGIR